MPNPDAHLGAVERDRSRMRQIEFEPSQGVFCVRCGAMATVALVDAVSKSILEIVGTLCAECGELSRGSDGDPVAACALCGKPSESGILYAVETGAKCADCLTARKECA